MGKVVRDSRKPASVRYKPRRIQIMSSIPYGAHSARRLQTCLEKIPSMQGGYRLGAVNHMGRVARYVCKPVLNKVPTKEDTGQEQLTIWGRQRRQLQTCLNKVPTKQDTDQEQLIIWSDQRETAENLLQIGINQKGYRLGAGNIHIFLTDTVGGLSDFRFF